MPGPKPIRVPLSPEILEKTGRLKEALRAAQREQRQLSRDIDRTIKKGEVADARTVGRLQQVEQLSERVRKRAAEERSAVQRIKSLEANQGKTLAAAEGLQTLFAGDVARKLARGEKLSGTDIAVSLLTAQQALATPIKNVIERFKFGKNLAQKLGKITPLIPFIGGAIAAGIDANEQIKQEKATAENIGRLFASNQISADEFELFQKRQRAGFFGDPANVVNLNKQVAKILGGGGNLTRDQLRKVFKEDLKQFFTLEEGFFEGQGAIRGGNNFDEFLENFEELKNERRRKTGFGRLPKEDIDEILRMLTARFFKDATDKAGNPLGDKFIDELLEKIIEKDQEAGALKVNRRQDASERYRAFEKARIDEANFQLRTERIIPGQGFLD